jgi:hypothetical protein
LVLETDFSLTAKKVTCALARLASASCLTMITVDNGQELISKEMDSWTYRNTGRLDFIRPG